MTHFEVIEFNRERLARGGRHCFRAKVFVNGEPDGLVWLSHKDIKAILKDEDCTVSGYEKYIAEKKYESF